MAGDFNHRSLDLSKGKKLVYTALSKHYFCYRMFISKYVLEQDKVPVNPFMVFDYFMLDTVDRDLVRSGNNSLVIRCDELWVFGPVSNGVLSEIKIARADNKPIKYFTIQKSQHVVPVSKEDVEMENEVKQFRSEL